MPPIRAVLLPLLGLAESAYPRRACWRKVVREVKVAVLLIDEVTGVERRARVKDLAAEAIVM